MSVPIYFILLALMLVCVFGVLAFALAVYVLITVLIGVGEFCSSIFGKLIPFR